MQLYSPSIPWDMRPKIPKKTGFLGLPASQAYQLAAHGATHSVLPGVNPPAPQAPATDPNGGFYPFQDYYGGLLDKLASMRDLALSGLTTDLQNRTKAVQGVVDASRDPLNMNYSRAEQQAAAVNDAVSNRLSAQGATGTADLHSQLAALGQDPTAATADLSKYYAGTGGANYALDSGDVQRLIGRQAEESTLLNKQPALLAAQMNSDVANNQGSIISDYLDKAFGVAGQQADARSSYDTAKFGFQQDQKAAAVDAANLAEKTYWDNYWQKQDILFRKWQTQIASGDKNAALQTQKEIANSKAQSASEVANIRANASNYGADTRANATTAAATTRANATKDAAAIKAAKSTKSSSNINKQRAYQAARAAIIDPKTNHLVKGVNPTGYNSDWTITRIVHSVLKSYGINPQSPQGRSVTASILSQASGHKFAADSTAPAYKYDPNWAKNAKKAASKKKRGR